MKEKNNEEVPMGLCIIVCIFYLLDILMFYNIGQLIESIIDNFWDKCSF